MSALCCVLRSPGCTGPRVKGRGWSAQPEVARERFDIDRGGLQQAGDRQERDGRRIASRGRAPDDPGLSPGLLRHHRPEHLTVALEAVHDRVVGGRVLMADNQQALYTADAPLVSLPVRLPEFLALQLADHALGQRFGGEDHPGRLLVGSEPAGA